MKLVRKTLPITDITEKTTEGQNHKGNMKYGKSFKPVGCIYILK